MRCTFEANDASSLASTIRDLADDRDLCRSYANRAYQRARDRYNHKRMIDEYLQLVSQAGLGRVAPPPELPRVSSAVRRGSAILLILRKRFSGGMHVCENHDPAEWPLSSGGAGRRDRTRGCKRQASTT